MKKILNLIVSIILFTSVIGQDFKSPLDHTQGIRYKSDELLVKFKDDVQIVPSNKNSFAQTGIQSIDNILVDSEVISIDKLFANSKKVSNRQTITFPDGTSKKVPQFFNIYLLKTTGKVPVENIVEQLNTQTEIEYAEVNGEVYIEDFIPVLEVLSNDELSSKKGGSSRSTIPTPNDPLYDNQWYIPEVKADSLWETTTGDTTEVISILDTGVDYLHPDLTNKIWTNYNEIPDNGIDDDNNGYIDDTRGWDFVNQDNDPKDDNSHGTHCAGIAGAEVDNGIGIAGVSWGAKIMPVKCFQSNGYGYYSQIAEAIWYSAQNGATIYSCSWGGPGESITIRLALEYAYSTGLIVAACGNSGYKTDLPCPPWPPTVPMFPACYNWVLGVEATEPSQWNAFFSNFDPTGPVVSDGRPYGSMYYNYDDYNYEMRAPGVSILSTVPNGGYQYYNGTSMACPIVAGSIALMKSYDSTLTNEEVFAKLIQPVKINKLQAGVLDIYKCTLTDPPPDMYYKGYSITDTLDGDSDGRPDAGETLEIYITAKNAGGLGTGIWGKLRFSTYEDTTTAVILQDSCGFGSISPYATKQSDNPILVKIDSNVVNARIICFEILIMDSTSSGIDTLVLPLQMTIEHGIEIKGFYSYLHLYPNAYYLVTEPAIIDTLIVDPGVIIRFSSGWLSVVSKFISSGTADSMITYKASPGSVLSGITLANTCNSSINYCIFEDGGKVDFTVIEGAKTIYNSIFRLNSYMRLFESSQTANCELKYNVFCNNVKPYYNGYYLLDIWNPVSFKYNVVSNNEVPNRAPLGVYIWPQTTLDSITHNVFMGNNNYDFAAPQGLAVYHISDNYWGTQDSNVIRSHILDYFEDQTRAVLEPKDILIAPPAECHGVVWKVLINGQNPQDLNQPITLGAGSAKFDVYFNRPMDTTVMPFVTFGVRFPFTQNVIQDSAQWSNNNTIWTGYFTAGLKTGDGTNTVRVAYAEDLDHFEIPIENSRFSFNVQVAGSQSINFIATPGIGKVHLEWPYIDSLNTLGYNMYRFAKITDTIFSDTIKINSELINDTLYFDYAVSPETEYRYMYTMLSTDFAESDYSKVVSATPFDAANGDANGDLAVNVLDITTIVSYMLNQNPSPFLFDASDVNYDNEINVLDIIGLVQLINGKKSVSAQPLPDVSDEVAYYLFEGNKLRLESMGNVAALQFKLEVSSHKSGVRSQELELLDNLKIFSLVQGFEFAYSVVDDHIIGILYSLGGREMPEGIDQLFRFEGVNVNYIEISEIFGGDLNGNYVPILKKGTNSIVFATDAELQASPNPFTFSTQINYTVPESGIVEINLYDISGNEIGKIENTFQNAGKHSINWNGTNEVGQQLKSGIYLIQLKVKSVSGNSYSKEVKVVLTK